MKILEEEIKRRYEERKTAKISFWSNWLVKILLFLAIVVMIRYAVSVRELLQQGSTEENTELQSP